MHLLLLFKTFGSRTQMGSDKLQRNKACFSIDPRTSPTTATLSWWIKKVAQKQILRRFTVSNGKQPWRRVNIIGVHVTILFTKLWLDWNYNVEGRTATFSRWLKRLLSGSIFGRYISPNISLWQKDWEPWKAGCLECNFHLFKEDTISLEQALKGVNIVKVRIGNGNGADDVLTPARPELV